MRIYLAGMIGQGGPPGACLPSRAVLDTAHPYHLQSFAYPKEFTKWTGVWQRLPSDLLVDSGAFTVRQTGRPVSLRAYERFIKTFPERHPEVHAAEFITLDVIGDQRGTWRNFDRLRALGCPVMPVLTADSTPADVDRAMDAGSRMAFGGMTRASGQKTADQPDPWVTAAFERIRQRAGDGPIPRVHLLGVARPGMLRRVPAWSADATRWLGSLRWGQGIKRFGNRKLPPYNSGPQAAAAVLLEITTRVRKLQEVQDEATRLWQRRGITYQDDPDRMEATCPP